MSPNSLWPSRQWYNGLNWQRVKVFNLHWITFETSSSNGKRWASQRIQREEKAGKRRSIHTCTADSRGYSARWIFRCCLARLRLQLQNRLQLPNGLKWSSSSHGAAPGAPSGFHWGGGATKTWLQAAPTILHPNSTGEAVLLNVSQNSSSSTRKAAPPEESEPELFLKEPELCQTGS